MEEETKNREVFNLEIYMVSQKTSQFLLASNFGICPSIFILCGV